MARNSLANSKKGTNKSKKLKNGEMEDMAEELTKGDPAGTEKSAMLEKTGNDKTSAFLHDDDVFNCCICLDIVYNAMSVSPCTHKFCAGCILKWRKTSRTCPKCRWPIMDVHRDSSFSYIIDQYLKKYPEKVRDQQTRNDLDVIELETLETQFRRNIERQQDDDIHMGRLVDAPFVADDNEQRPRRRGANNHNYGLFGDQQAGQEEDDVIFLGVERNENNDDQFDEGDDGDSESSNEDSEDDEEEYDDDDGDIATMNWTGLHRRRLDDDDESDNDIEGSHHRRRLFYQAYKNMVEVRTSLQKTRIETLMREKCTREGKEFDPASLAVPALARNQRRMRGAMHVLDLFRRATPGARLENLPYRVPDRNDHMDMDVNGALRFLLDTPRPTIPGPGRTRRARPPLNLPARRERGTNNTNGRRDRRNATTNDNAQQNVNTGPGPVRRSRRTAAINANAAILRRNAR